MKLIPLRCPECQEPLNPGNEDLVIICQNCQSTVAISLNGPQKMNVRFAVPAGTPSAGVKQWLPFWVFQGRVDIKRRESQGGQSEDKNVQAMWGSPRHLYAPAWDVPLSRAQAIGSQMAEDQPRFEFVDQPESVQLLPAVVSPGDGRKLLEFVVLAIEARRKDWLKYLDFDLNVGQPELWAIPQSTFDKEIHNQADLFAQPDYQILVQRIEDELGN